ncbi:MAG: hypothetical protein ABIO17_06180 [Pseudoxanthomonas sp.]
MTSALHYVHARINRLLCFLENGARRYLHLLKDALHTNGRQRNVSVLMVNHAHLWVTP